jgi:predicted dienelactone hydrolase
MKSLIALLLLTTAAGADTLAGFDHLAVDAPHRPRPLEASVWYPAGSETYTAAIGANPAFIGTMVQVGPAIAAGQHPLVIISHGSGGNIDNLGWLAEGLVAKGAIVAGVNHPGATSGDSSPRQLPNVIDRTQDLAALIQTLTADPAFGPTIDPAQITALGFSLGGATALAAGGARFDAKAFGAYCDHYGKDASECVFMAKGGADPHAMPASYEADMTVPGLAHIIAVDPAMGHALNEASLAHLPPVHLIKLGDGDLVPPARDIGPEGSNLAARIAGATYTNITPGWHFSFLGLCTPDAPAMLIAEGEDPICDDPKGADRQTVHDQIIDDVATALGL